MVCILFARIYSLVTESSCNLPFFFFLVFQSLFLLCYFGSRAATLLKHPLCYLLGWLSGQVYCIYPDWFLYPQANLQRIYWPAHTGPVTVRKLKAGAHLGAWNPGLPDSFQPHHSWIWFSSHMRCNDLPPELPKWGAQTSGQDVLEFWQWNPGILGEREQVHWQDGQAQEMRAQKEKTWISQSQNTLILAALSLFWTFWNLSLVLPFWELILYVGVYVCFQCKCIFLQNFGFVTDGYTSVSADSK